MACLRTEVDGWVFSFDYAQRSLLDHFQLLALDGCGLEGKPLAVGAAGAILHYLRDTQKSALDHLERPSFYDRCESLVLDAVTVRNLELVEPLFAGESKRVHAARGAGPDRHRNGRSFAAPASAAACDGTGRNRGAPRFGGGTDAGYHPARRDSQTPGGRFWIWSGCWRRSRWERPVRARCSRWDGRLRGIEPLRERTGGHARRSGFRTCRAPGSRCPRFAIAF